MEIIRKIGPHEILVNTNAGMELSLEASILQNLKCDKVDNEVSLSKTEILKLLSAGDSYLPLSMHWELTDKCNYLCPFCYIVGHSKCKPVEFEKIKTHLSSLLDNGLLFCLLTGGEVTTHPDFYQIYHFLKSNGVIVEILTNGYQIDAKLLDLFDEFRPSKIEISIYSLDNEKLQDITSIKDSDCAEIVLRNIIRIKKIGIHVVCKTFANKFTYDELDSIQSWCSKNGIEHYIFSEIMNANDGKNLQGFGIPGSSVVNSKCYSEKVCFPCPTKNYGCSINSSFEISPCSLLKLPDCNFSLFQFGVNGALLFIRELILKYKDRVINGCENCQYSKQCNICIATAIPIRNNLGQITSFSANPEICISRKQQLQLPLN